MKLKSNKYWFRSKYYGWGFFPISWEGWLATLVVILLIMASAYSNGFFTDPEHVSGENVVRYLFDVAIISVVLTLVFKPKTRGKLRWRWGK